jgi:hypothetical protein
MVSDTYLTILKGPVIGNGMLFVSINLVAFLVTMIFVLRSGSGKIAKPISLIGIGFFLSACVPLTLGEEYLFLVPVIETILILSGLMWLMRIYGIFEMISKR